MLLVLTVFVHTAAPIAAFRKRDKHEKDDLGAEKVPQGLPLFFFSSFQSPISLPTFFFHLSLKYHPHTQKKSNFSDDKTYQTLTKLRLRDYT